MERRYIVTLRERANRTASLPLLRGDQSDCVIASGGGPTGATSLRAGQSGHLCCAASDWPAAAPAPTSGRSPPTLFTLAPPLLCVCVRTGEVNNKCRARVARRESAPESALCAPRPSAHYERIVGSSSPRCDSRNSPPRASRRPEMMNDGRQFQLQQIDEERPVQVERIRRAGPHPSGANADRDEPALTCRLSRSSRRSTRSRSEEIRGWISSRSSQWRSSHTRRHWPFELRNRGPI